MKNLFFIAFLILVLNGSVHANKSDLFYLDETIINNEFREINKLDEFLDKNTGLLLHEIKAMVKESSNLIFGNEGEPPLGLSGFVWGFIGGLAGGCGGCFTCFTSNVLGPAAIALVYFTTEDNKETMNSLWGCLAGSAVGVGISWILYIVYYGTAYTYTY